MKTSLKLFIITAAVAVVSLADPALFYSPGELRPGHTSLQQQCSSCHNMQSSKARTCATCHVPAAIIRHKNYPADSCLSCHFEHKRPGIQTRLTAFEHTGLEKNCATCHERPAGRLHQKTLNQNCNSCHTKEAWSPADFDHSLFFRLDRRHDVVCKSCHTEQSYQTFSCTGCHAHSERKIAREHREEGILIFDNCVLCHRSSSERQAKRAWRNLKAELKQSVQWQQALKKKKKTDNYKKKHHKKKKHKKEHDDDDD